MFVIGIGTATPAQRYEQTACWEALRASRQFKALAVGSRALLKKVLLGDNGIDARYLALEKLEDAFAITPDVLLARFTKHAPALAAQAAERSLRQAGLTPAAIDGLLISTCTGYLCPGLTSYVSERLGLRPDIRTLDLVGQGCGAAMPNLQTAAALLAAGQCRHVLSICVEVCSAAFYLDDDPGVLVSACLFGDGAAAVVLTDKPALGRRRIEWSTGVNLLNPADRDRLRFEQRGGMLRNVLSKEVPVLAARYASQVFAATIQQAGINREQVTEWILHPGGRTVLQAVSKQLELNGADVRWSTGVLREYGNLSSPSVLFVLEAALQGGAPGGFWWMASFGAGFSAYGALLKVEP